MCGVLLTMAAEKVNDIRFLQRPVGFLDKWDGGAKAICELQRDLLLLADGKINFALVIGDLRQPLLATHVQNTVGIGSKIGLHS